MKRRKRQTGSITATQNTRSGPAGAVPSALLWPRMANGKQQSTVFGTYSTTLRASKIEIAAATDWLLGTSAEPSAWLQSINDHLGNDGIADLAGVIERGRNLDGVRSRRPAWFTPLVPHAALLLTNTRGHADIS